VILSDEAGMEVRRERSWQRLEMVVLEGRVRGVISPESSLTKICMLSSDLEEVEVADTLEEVRECMMGRYGGFVRYEVW